MPNDEGSLTIFENVSISSDKDVRSPKDYGSNLIDLHPYRLILMRFFRFFIDYGKAVIVDCFKLMSDKLTKLSIFSGSIETFAPIKFSLTKLDKFVKLIGNSFT